MDLSKNLNYIEYQNSLAQISDQQQILYNNYNHLNKNNQEINSLVREFQTLNSAYRDQSQLVTTNYYNYIVLLFVALLLLFLFLRFSEKQSGGGNTIHLDKNIIFYFVFVVFVFIVYNILFTRKN
jgi:4-amino-4-deoxy-L-arabinose transferase-like glycosyltransferase